MYGKWESNFEEQIKMEKRKAKYTSILTNIPQTIQTFYPLLIYVIGYTRYLQNQITIGGVVAFSVIGAAFLTPILSIMNSYSQFLLVKIYLDRLLDILETPTETSLFGKGFFQILVAR